MELRTPAPVDASRTRFARSACSTAFRCPASSPPGGATCSTTSRPSPPRLPGGGRGLGDQHPHRAGGQEEQGQPARPQAGQAPACPSSSTSIAELEAKKAELDATIKAATASDEDDEDGDAEEPLSEDELKALKKELSAAKKKLKAKEGNFTKRLQEARSALDEDGARDLVLGILRADLDGDLGAVRRRPSAAGRRGVRELVGQVPGDADEHRRGAGRGGEQAARVPRGPWLCVSWNGRSILSCEWARRP